MIPKMATGAPMPDISESVRKKQPMGTPALPMAEMTEMRIQRSRRPQVTGLPPFCMTKSEVTRMKAAQPFMFTVVQTGRTKRAMFCLMPKRFSAVSMVTGSVAALLFVKKAMRRAGIIFLNTRTGFSPLNSKNRGSTTKD